MNPCFGDAAFRRKSERRKDLAALPIEEKIEMLVQLQYLAWQVARETGRPCRTPWGFFEEKLV